jgi:nucleotide-binding universal stress UspA family protein
LHVLNVLDNTDELYLRAGDIPVAAIERYRHSAERLARDTLAEQLKRGEAANLKPAPMLHVVAGRPAQVIKEVLDAERIELLVLGTVARGGLPGMLVGNTAERLLPQVPCSILAVKPEGFVSPIAE